MYHKALNNYVLTMDGAVNDSTTTFTVLESPADLTAKLPVYMNVGSEIVEVTGVSSNDLTVVRGVADTTAGAHDDGDSLRLNVIAETINELIDGVSAVLVNPMTTQGDMILRDDTTIPARLAIGNDGDMLWTDGIDPSWESQDTKLRTTQAIGNLTSTGLLTGGDLSINANPALFDMTAGTAIVVDNYTDPLNPVYSHVSWSAFTGVAVTDIATNPRTDIGIDSAGAIFQSPTALTTGQRRDYVQIGRLIHLNNTTINGVTNVHHHAFDQLLTASDLSDSIGSLNRTGNVYSANGANLQINKSSGEIYRIGSNQDDEQNPNITSNDPETISIMRMTYQDGSGGFTVGPTITEIDPDNYDDGSGTPVSVSVNKWTVQRLFYFTEGGPPQANTFVHYGQVEYNSLAAAEQALFTENVATNPILADATFRAWLIVKNGETALNSANTDFVEVAKFGGAGGGGTSSITDLQTAYNNSITPQIILSASGGVFDIQDASTPIATDLLSVRTFGGGNRFIGVDVNGIYVGATHNASAGIDLTSTTQGIGLPNMTTTQRNAISTPKEGLLIWNVTTAQIERYGSASWNSEWSMGNLKLTGQAWSETNTLTDAVTIATDCDLGNVHQVTLTDNRTLGAPTNLKGGATYIWVISQDVGGTNTLAYNAVFKFPGGTAPVLSTAGSAVDILSGWSDGTNVYATLQKEFS